MVCTRLELEQNWPGLETTAKGRKEGPVSRRNVFLSHRMPEPLNMKSGLRGRVGSPTVGPVHSLPQRLVRGLPGVLPQESTLDRAVPYHRIRTILRLRLVPSAVTRAK